METKLISPTLLLFLQGLIGMIITWVVILLSFAIEPSKSSLFYINIAEVFRVMYSKNNLGSYFGYFLGSIVYNLFYVLTKYYFSPILIAIGDSFSNITLFTIAIILGGIGRPMNLTLIIAGYSVILIGCLVYNEIVILYCCKLDEYTKKGIKERGQRETWRLNHNLEIQNGNFDEFLD